MENPKSNNNQFDDTNDIDDIDEEEEQEQEEEEDILSTISSDDNNINNDDIDDNNLNNNTINNQNNINTDSESDIDNNDNDDDDDDDDDDENIYNNTNHHDEDNIQNNTSTKLTSQNNNDKLQIFKPASLFTDNLETNDSYQFLQKFDKEIKNDFISSYHQECYSKNYNEIKHLINVIKDKNNNIIDELHKTLPILTKYEKTKILGIRLKQLNNGSLPYIKVSEDLLDNFIIAKNELKLKKLPFIIQRPLPNNTFEYWKLEDLEII